MSQPHKWEEEIKIVLGELGGEAPYCDIYQLIEDRNIMILGDSWKSAIRGCMERFSSNSQVYKKGGRDVFYSVNGIGEGVWGLRDYKVTMGKNNLTEDDNAFPEGKKILKLHIGRERNPQVIRDAKENFKNIHGKLYCEVCRFDFFAKYGEIGQDFIEGHHTIPICDMNEDAVTRVEDIALVCSNCHSMLHRKRPWIKKEELSDLLK